MNDNSKKADGASRRDVLRIGAFALGGMGIAGGAEAQIAQKTHQKNVSYQQSPKDGKQCSLCLHFQAPNGCRVVDGEINPSGYCVLFVKKS
jgi:hypothetical protein